MAKSNKRRCPAAARKCPYPFEPCQKESHRVRLNGLNQVFNHPSLWRQSNKLLFKSMIVDIKKNKIERHTNFL